MTDIAVYEPKKPSRHFRFTPKGLIIEGHPTFDECGQAAFYIYFWGKNARTFLGDLLNYMEGRWGEGYAQILDATDFSYQTIANTKSVMNRVPHEVRPEGGLTFTHYREVASLPKTEQRKLLEQARKEELNTSEFRRIVRQKKRKARLEILPQRVKLEVNLIFNVPEDLMDKVRFAVEGMVNRLEEWDIECELMEYGNCKEIGNESEMRALHPGH